VLIFVIYGGSMFDDTAYLIDDLKGEIYRNYPSVKINVVVSNDSDEYFFSINNRDLYYSEDFQLFLMNFKKDRLWANDIYNIFFTLDEMVNVIDSISFSKNILTAAIVNWRADNISIKMNSDISYDQLTVA
jgi:hypothetical protein